MYSPLGVGGGQAKTKILTYETLTILFNYLILYKRLHRYAAAKRQKSSASNSVFP